MKNTVGSSIYLQIIPNRFLPPPIPVVQKSDLQLSAQEVMQRMKQQELEWMVIDEVEMDDTELSSVPTKSNSSGTPTI